MDSVSCQDIQREHNTNIPIIYYTDVPWKECAIVPGNEETVELIRMEQQNSVALRQYSYKISKGVTMDVDDEDDPVPEITKMHFEESMKFARRYRMKIFQNKVKLVFF